MTRQESFKVRIRTRMEKTGERYAAARHALLEQATARRRRAWVCDPETSDASVMAATGKGWDDWCDLIDAWPGNGDGHAAIAAHLVEAHGVDGWWAQTVTVGYERIVGRRLPYQRADGTFTASKSRTVDLDARALRAMLLDADDRVELFPAHPTTLRSRPDAKAIRLAIGPGTAQISLEPRADGRVKVTISHERLPTFDDVEVWRFYWAEWLDALASA